MKFEKNNYNFLQKNNCKPIQSLFEVEYFLRKLSTIKNTLCTAKGIKKLSNKCH